MRSSTKYPADDDDEAKATKFPVADRVHTFSIRLIDPDTTLLHRLNRLSCTLAQNPALQPALLHKKIEQACTPPRAILSTLPAAASSAESVLGYKLRLQANQESGSSGTAQNSTCKLRTLAHLAFMCRSICYQYVPRPGP